MINEPAQYVIYIDEAGDPGIKQKSADELRKASEWFVVSALVVRKSRDRDLPVWLEDMREAVRAQSRSPMHFHKLSLPNQHRVCRMLATKDVRLFSVASHKTNMRAHQNKRMGTSLGRGEFYNWCLRLLLERVTDWCAKRSEKEGIGKSAEIVFSERGGHDYAHLISYLDYLVMQAENRKTFLNAREIALGVVHSTRIMVYPHHRRAGLQLVDIVASAMFQGADTTTSKATIDHALALKPRTAKANGRHAEYGLMMLPFRHRGDIPAHDRPLFEAFDYRW